MSEPPRGPVPPAPPDQYGAFAAVDGLGGVAAPLLAGFAVTLLALVVQVEGQLRWPDAVLALLAAAMVLFLQVVQLNARAKGYAVTPAQATEWYDDMAAPDRRAVVYWELRHHHEAWASLVRRTRVRYNLGIVALLAGCAGMLVPRDDRALGGTRLAAIAVVVAGIALELLDLAAQRLSRTAAPGRGARAGTVLRRGLDRLVPLYPPVTPPPFPEPPFPEPPFPEPPFPEPPGEADDAPQDPGRG